jgi:4-hydroxybenzoate polyprenyltransferase
MPRPTENDQNQRGARESELIPLVVDLDGALLRTDLLLESALRLVKQKPWTVLSMPLWILHGRSHLKRKICNLVQMDVTRLPMHMELLAWLKEEKSRGRQLVLATASDRDQAYSVVESLQLFDVVLGSDGKHNLKGQHKLKAIAGVFGYQFDYVGNSRADLEIWRSCRQAILVNAPDVVERSAGRGGNVSRVFPRESGRWREVLRALRSYQWVKNLLVFVPAITSHTIFHWAVAIHAMLAFLAFGFFASGVYVMNDLLDLEEDRNHSNKKERPFASGRLPIAHGIALLVVLLSLGVGTGVLAGGQFLGILIAYLALTSWYSFHLKQIPLIDVFTLTALYILRIIAGHVITGIAFSNWLLLFAFFLFLSLAFSKRAAELISLGSTHHEVLLGRGYVPRDYGVVVAAGICSAFLSTLVLALYINSHEVQKLYRSPLLLWGLIPVLLYYLTRLWLICGRGQLTDDPILYTAKTKSTYGAALVTVAILLAATYVSGFGT